MNENIVVKHSRRSKNANHVNRIIGQLNALKRLMESDASCLQIANLALTIRNSVNSLSVRVLEGYVINQVLPAECRKNQGKLQEIQALISLYR